MEATCINVRITWSDGRLTLSVHTALFKQFTDALQPVVFTKSDWEVKGTVHHSLLEFYLSSWSHIGGKQNIS